MLRKWFSRLFKVPVTRPRLTIAICVTALTLLHHSAGSQSVDSDTLSGRPVLGKTGQLFAIRFNPGSRRLTVHMAGGDPLAQIDSSRVEILGRKLARSGSSENLNLVDVESYFEIKNQVEPDSTLEIQVKDKKSHKSETFRLEMKAKD